MFFIGYLPASAAGTGAGDGVAAAAVVAPTRLGALFAVAAAGAGRVAREPVPAGCADAVAAGGVALGPVEALALRLAILPVHPRLALFSAELALETFEGKKKMNERNKKRRWLHGNNRQSGALIKGQTHDKAVNLKILLALTESLSQIAKIPFITKTVTLFSSRNR
jgi:hypothetical protein